MFNSYFKKIHILIPSHHLQRENQNLNLEKDKKKLESRHLLSMLHELGYEVSDMVMDPSVRLVKALTLGHGDTV